MKIANSIKLSVFVKEGEDKEKIKTTLLKIIPFNLEQEKILIGQKKAIGFNEKEILIYEIILEKERHINSFIENLNKILDNEVKERLLNQADTRLDEECNFFLRFNKEKLLNNEFWLTDQGNCFHIKINIAVFPKKKENALEIIRKVFKVEE